MRPKSPFRILPPARSGGPGRGLRSSRRRPLPGLLLVLAPVALACGGGEGGGRQRAATGCARLDTSAVVKAAVLQFVATTEPKPLRFLYVPGTSETLPEAGIQALQDKGPTYIFPSDSASQRKVREQLARVGPWNALLVTWHGMTQPTPESATVRIGGRFVGSDNDGQEVPVRDIGFACRTAGDSAYQWRPTTGAGGSGT